MKNQADDDSTSPQPTLLNNNQENQPIDQKLIDLPRQTKRQPEGLE